MGLYIQMHSMHGLFRSQNLELGRDEDTGGQIVYVLELAKALADLKEVDKVDIITRRIIDRRYSGYSEEIEKVTSKVSIVRIECGPKKYIMKVDLWPHLNEFIDNCKKYIKKIKRKPDILQSNYADSGLVCSILSKELNIPQVHTGHSLGIPKMQRLGVNKRNFREFNKTFHFDKRIRAEAQAIQNSSAIIASTKEESRQQYKGYNVEEHYHKFRTIPPGLDLHKFYPPRGKLSEEEIRSNSMLNNVIKQSLKHPERRLVSVLSRLDKRKNITALLRAFAYDRKFQSMANLLIFAPTLDGNKEAQKIINKINQIIREKNLYENIAIPGIHLNYETQVPAYYRFLSVKRGIFVNPALIEPFGLTTIEASACGVPVVVTKYGGPSEIITTGVTGLLIDPKDPKDIAKKIKKLIRHNELYRKISKNGISMIRRSYTWKASAKKYFKVFKQVAKFKVKEKGFTKQTNMALLLTMLNK